MRLRRKEQLLREATGLEITQQEPKSGPCSWPPDAARDKRTVFVGNVPVAPPLHRVKLALLKLLKPHGRVETIRFRSFAVDLDAKGPRLTKKEALTRQRLAKHKPNMNAYVVFVSEVEARKAAAEVNGVNLTVSWNVTAAGASGKTALAGGIYARTRLSGNASLAKAAALLRQNTRRMEVSRVLRCDVASGARFIAQLSIFVGGLPYKEADEDVLRAKFERFGLIDNVRIIRDKATGVCKGFGYVQFRNESSVDAAVEWGRTGSGGGATASPDLHQPQPKPSRRSKYRNATCTASPGKIRGATNAGLMLRIGSKSYLLRVMPAMKKTELSRYQSRRTFIKRGGTEGLHTRTKRWRNRKAKREKEKGAEKSTATDSPNGAQAAAMTASQDIRPTRWQETTDRWKALKKRSSTQLMTKGQRKALNLKVEKLKSTISSHPLVGAAGRIARKGTAHVSKSPAAPHVAKSPIGQNKKK